MTEKFGAIYLRLEPDLHKSLKIQAIHEGKTLNKLVCDLLKKFNAEIKSRS